MSEIERLLAEHCPQGVEYRPLGEFVNFLSGSAFPSSEFNNEGDGLPLIRVRDVNSGIAGTYYSGSYEDRYLVHPGDLLISMDGDFRVKEWSGPVSLLNQRVCRVQDFSDRTDRRFVYWAAQAALRRIHGETQSSTVKHLSTKVLGATLIPVPPLVVQREVVEILDRMERLEAELEAELEARRRQYAYYRDALLLRDHRDLERLPLTAVAIDFGRGKSKHRPRNDPRLYGGEYPFIQTGDVRSSGHLITKYSQTLNEEGLAQSKLWPRGTICITIAANIAETGVLAFDACFPDSVIGVVVDSAMASSHYVEYLLQAHRHSVAAQGSRSAQANINLGTFETALFPFPPLEEQERIAATLGSLDALVNDLSSGLPAEIATRRKQYEYYRDRLLSFEELVA